VKVIIIFRKCRLPSNMDHLFSRSCHSKRWHAFYVFAWDIVL